MKNRKYYSIILIILLISVMALAQEGTTSSDIEKVNKSGDTMTGNLYLSKIMSKHGANLSYFGFPVSTYSEWFQNTSGMPDNRIRLYSDAVAFYSDIDLNNHNISECANCGTADNSTIQINESQVNNLNNDLNGKLNKSDDILTGKLNVNNYTLENLYFLNVSKTMTVFSNKTLLPLDIITSDVSGNIPRYFSYNNATSTGNYFVGVHFRGNTSYPRAQKTNDHMFYIAGAGGYDTSGTASGTRVAIDLMASEEWNSTSQGAHIDIYTTATGTTTLTKRIRIDNNGDFYIYSLSGTGYRYLCLDDSEKIIQSTTACDLI